MRTKEIKLWAGAKMDITGSDYTYLSNIGPDDVEILFMGRLQEIWPSPLVEVFDRTRDHIELFVARDVKMNSFCEEKGFSLDRNGQGCFMFCARKFSFLNCQ